MNRYTGVYMKSRTILPGTKTLLKLTTISSQAKRRLQWLDWHRSHGENARLTCRHFGISPDTFYRWKRRYKSGNIQSLESHTTKPQRVRCSSITWETTRLIIKLRKQNMALSKYKLSRILEREHQIKLSPSSIGRILAKQGLIKQAQMVRGIKQRKRMNYSIPRKRACFSLRHKAPGHLVQVDTKHLIVLGRTFYQFTAVDCYTKLAFSYTYTSITSSCARDFLRKLLYHLPFKVKAIQTDNGSEYLLHFHRECCMHGITHYFSYPKTPKHNALVERLIQTTEYELWLFDQDLIPELDYINHRLSVWIGRYNTYRPHQTLNYLTPMEYYQQQKGDEVYER